MQKKEAIVLIAFLVVGFFLGYLYSKNKLQSSLYPQELIESFNSAGWGLYYQGDYDGAIAEFKKYLRKDPNNFYALDGIAWSYYRKNSFQEAADYFKQAIKSAPQNPYLDDAYEGLGSSYLGIAYPDNGPDYDSEEKIKNINDSIYYFEKAVELNNENWGAYYGLGFALIPLKDYEKAIEALDTAIELNPTHGPSYSSLGWANYWLAYTGKKPEAYSDAMEFFEKANQLNPNDEYTLSGLGWVQLRLGMHDKAVDNFNKALGIKENSLSYAGLGSIYLNGANKDYQKAIEYADKAIVMSPYSARYYLIKGFGYIGMEEYELAREEFKNAAELDSKIPEIYNGMKIVSEHYGDIELASKFQDCSNNLREAQKIRNKIFENLDICISLV